MEMTWYWDQQGRMQQMNALPQLQRKERIQTKKRERQQASQQMAAQR